MNAPQIDPSEMPQGAEEPPPGVRIMAVVRWILIGGFALLALFMTADWLSQRRDHAGAADTAAAAPKQYQCPMHPQIIQDHPGECPICGMDLVEVKAAAPAPKAVERWQCPMHPQIIQDHAGECPICGMDLVKAQPAETGAHAGEGLPELATVHLPAERVQKIGVKTVAARTTALSEKVQVSGMVVAAESRTAHVHARFTGWVDEIFVQETGQAVKAGDPLLRIHSPEVVQAQRELAAARRSDSSDPLALSLRNAAEARLRTLGVDPGIEEADAGVRSSVLLVAPRSGFVTRRAAVLGLYVTPDTELYEIGDLSVVWVLADLREDVIARVAVGRRAIVRVSALPETTFEGTLTYLYPQVDPRTRSLKARIELPNKNGRLRPGMYADVDIALPAVKGVVIPRDAVIPTGTGQYVFVRRPDGAFEPRRITTGARTADQVEVLTGVNDAEDVVTGALFMLDSESRLRAVLERASAGSAPPPTGAHDHGGAP